MSTLGLFFPFRHLQMQRPIATSIAGTSTNPSPRSEKQKIKTNQSFRLPPQALILTPALCRLDKTHPYRIFWAPVTALFISRLLHQWNRYFIPANCWEILQANSWLPHILPGQPNNTLRRNLVNLYIQNGEKKLRCRRKQTFSTRAILSLSSSPLPPLNWRATPTTSKRVRLCGWCLSLSWTP